MPRFVSPRATVVAALVSVMASGCTHISYKPALSLPESPRTIRARVVLEKLVDASPSEDKGGRFGGVSATEPNTMAGDLADEVTQAVLVDLNSSQVFESVKRRSNVSPDLVMTGAIHRFYGTAGISVLGWVTLPIDIVWFFGVPPMSAEGVVDLEFAVARPKGEVLARYRCRSSFSSYHTMYDNPTLGVGTKLNKAFGEVFARVREQLIADEPVFVSGLSGSPAGSVRVYACPGSEPPVLGQAATQPIARQ